MLTKYSFSSIKRLGELSSSFVPKYIFCSLVGSLLTLLLSIDSSNSFFLPFVPGSSFSVPLTPFLFISLCWDLTLSPSVPISLSLKLELLPLGLPISFSVFSPPLPPLSPALLLPLPTFPLDPLLQLVAPFFLLNFSFGLKESSSLSKLVSTSLILASS